MGLNKSRGKVKATELRIGNYLVDREDRLCKVEAVKPDEYNDWDYSFEAPAISGAITGLPHKPIEFNKDWQKRCLLHDGIGVHNSSFSGFITVKEDAISDSWIFCVGEIELRIFRYLHQLQNLFSSLTDEDLMII